MDIMEMEMNDLLEKMEAIVLAAQSAWFDADEKLAQRIYDIEQQAQVIVDELKSDGNDDEG